MRILLFQLMIIDHTAFYGIDQKQFARVQTFFQYDMLFIDRQHTYFRCQHQRIIIGNIITGRTQTVAVQDCAHDIAIGKYDGCRTIPWLHHRCIILVEIADLLRDRIIVCPRLRNADHCCQRQFHSAHHQKLQCVIQHGRIGSVPIYDRQYLVQIVPKMLTCHVFFAGQHLIGISADRVDLTVVYDEAVRMCTLPARIRVGRETGMHHRDRRFVILALQIFKERTQLANQKHAFVYDGAAAHGYHIGIVITLFKLSSGHIQFAVKIQSACHLFGTLDKRLADIRHAVDRTLSEYLRTNRHFTPSQQFQSFLLQDHFKHLSGLGPLQLLLRQKQLGNTVISLISESDPAVFLKKSVGNLQKNTDTVPGLALGILTCTMLQIFHDPQCILHDRMTFRSLDVDNRSDPAVIMFKLFPVQTLLHFYLSSFAWLLCRFVKRQPPLNL